MKSITLMLLTILAVAVAAEYTEQDTFTYARYYRNGDPAKWTYNPEFDNKTPETPQFRALNDSPTTITVQPEHYVTVNVWCYNKSKKDIIEKMLKIKWTKSDDIDCKKVGEHFEWSGRERDISKHEYRCKNKSDSAATVRLDKYKCEGW